MKRTYLALIFVGICITAFFTGVLTGYIRHKANIGRVKINTEEIRAVAQEEATVEEADAKIPELSCYEVYSEGRDIVLSEVFSDDSRNEIERTEINIEVLPRQDIELLKEGIKFPDKTEALMMMENFVS